MLQLLYSWRNTLQYPLKRSYMGPKGHPDTLENRKISLPCQDLTHNSLVVQPVALVTTFIILSTPQGNDRLIYYFIFLASEITLMLGSFHVKSTQLVTSLTLILITFAPHYNRNCVFKLPQPYLTNLQRYCHLRITNWFFDHI
jgi:hypothetical protein